MLPTELTEGSRRRVLDLPRLGKSDQDFLFQGQ